MEFIFLELRTFILQGARSSQFSSVEARFLESHLDTDFFVGFFKISLYNFPAFITFFLLYSLYSSVLLAGSHLLAGHWKFLGFWGISFHWKRTLFEYISNACAIESLSRKILPYLDSCSILLVFIHAGLWSWGSQSYSFQGSIFLQSVSWVSPGCRCHSRNLRQGKWNVLGLLLPLRNCFLKILHFLQNLKFKTTKDRCLRKAVTLLVQSIFLIKNVKIKIFVFKEEASWRWRVFVR